MIRALIVRAVLIASACLAVLYLSLFSAGAFAFDRSAYITVQGLKVDGGGSMMEARGVVYTIKLDRAYGSDRTLYTTLNASEAWQFLGMWDARNAPSDILRLLSEGKIDR